MFLENEKVYQKVRALYYPIKQPLSKNIFKSWEKYYQMKKLFQSQERHYFL